MLKITLSRKKGGHEGKGDIDQNYHFSKEIECRKWYVVYYLPIAERILCLIFGFSRKTDSARFNIKKQGLTLISFHARHCLFNLLLVLAISPLMFMSGHLVSGMINFLFPAPFGSGQVAFTNYGLTPECFSSKISPGLEYRLAPTRPMAFRRRGSILPSAQTSSFM